MARERLMQGGNGVIDLLQEMHGNVADGLEANDRALGNAELAEELDLEKGFDVVVVKPADAGESGYHLALRSRAALAVVLTYQSSDQTVDLALGQPHHPVLQPFPLLRWHSLHSFWQRVASTVATCGYQLYRFIVGKKLSCKCSHKL